MTTKTTMIQGVVVSSCNGCRLLPLVLFCLYLLSGTRRELQGRSMDEDL